MNTRKSKTSFLTKSAMIAALYVLLTEISAAICKDSGNESMGKSLQILSAVAAIWLSIPVFERLITLLDKILGTI